MLGESERKIRDLFENARQDQERHGSDSNLHVIVFDEIDAICKRRSCHVEGTLSNVEDKVTTQLLAEIDGMVHLDNIFLIGTTNILHMVDPALLRSGRIDTIIEIGVPDESGRLQIFDIYTKHLLRNGILQADVNVDHIVRSSQGFTGAQIEHIVRLAVHNAMRRDILNKGHMEVTYEDADQLQVCNKDFTMALAKVPATNFQEKIYYQN
jgi:vesicle-fusing ATPase